MATTVDIEISNAIEFSATAQPAPLGDQPDPLLVDLVRLVDTLNVEHGISLTVGGSLITATLFSAFRYFEGLAVAAAAGHVVGSADNDTGKQYQRHMIEFYTARMKLYDPARIGAADAHYTPRYIHLHNARWIGSDGLFVGEAKLWRGRLVSVNGFSIIQV